MSAKTNTKALANLASILRQAPDLYGMDGTRLTMLRKALLDVKAVSNQGATRGLKSHPFNRLAVRDYANFNPHHSACIYAKVNATVGQGFKSEKVAEILDPLCEHSSADLLATVAQDYWEVGEGYIEIVRPRGEEDVISGLHHLPAGDAYMYLEDSFDLSKRHYEVISMDEGLSTNLLFARFGDRKAFLKRYKIKDKKEDEISEVVHWRMPSSQSRWYGYPEYLSAVPSIELVQAMTQHEFNFFFNNGVPEFIIFVLGKLIPTPDWDKFINTLKANQGVRNSQRSQAVNFGDPEVDVKVEKLGGTKDSGETPYAVHSEVTATNIVTAHGVPPILAGILIPGKLGAANETTNALLLFHLMKTQPAQRGFSLLLAASLGSEGQKFRNPDGVDKTLTREDFLGPKEAKGNGFNTIMDAMNLQAMDTAARMREPLAGSGRDPSKGLLSSSDDRAQTGGRPVRGNGRALAQGRGAPASNGRPRG